MIRYLAMITLIGWMQFSSVAQAQMKGMPSLPSGAKGFSGSVGVGFTDFTVVSPSGDFRVERGTYLTTQIERGFDVFHLYLTFGLGMMDASGIANYEYTNLSSTQTYSLNDVDFGARFMEITLGLKLKLIDNYWFRPYIEGGGLGSYNEVSYKSEIGALSTVGNDFKTKDVIMGSGHYYEGGLEIQFTDKFGIKLGARKSQVETKSLDTLRGRSVQLQNETYYLSGVLGI